MTASTSLMDRITNENWSKVDLKTFDEILGKYDKKFKSAD